MGDVSETKSALFFGSRAMKITNTAYVNVEVRILLDKVTSPLRFTLSVRFLILFLSADLQYYHLWFNKSFLNNFSKLVFQVDYKRLSEDLTKIVDMRGTFHNDSKCGFSRSLHHVTQNNNPGHYRETDVVA